MPLAGFPWVGSWIYIPQTMNAAVSACTAIFGKEGPLKAAKTQPQRFQWLTSKSVVSGDLEAGGESEKEGEVLYAILSATRYWMRIYSMLVIPSINTDRCWYRYWMLDTRCSGHYTDRCCEWYWMLDTRCWVMRFRLETTDAAFNWNRHCSNTGTTQEHHSQHYNRRAQQHRHYPASSIQYRASLTAKISIPTLQHSNTPAFQPQSPTTPALPSIQHPVSSITHSKDQYSNRSIEYPVSSIEYRDLQTVTYH